MSALGHKQTLALRKGISTLAQKRYRIRIFGRQLRANSGHREERSALHINAWSKQDRQRLLFGLGWMAQLIAQLRTPIAPNEILQFSCTYIEVLSDSLALT